MWDALGVIAGRENQSIHSLTTEIDRRRGATALTSAVRVFALAYYQNLADDLEARLKSGRPPPEPTNRPKGSTGARDVLDMVFGPA